MTKEQIIAAIKAKFPKVNLSKKRLDAIAAKKVFEGVEEAADLDAKIVELDEIMDFADLAKQDDTQRNLAAKLKAVEDQLNPEDKDKDKEKPKETPLPEGMPEWMKPFMEAQRVQAEQLGKILSREQTTTVAEKLKADKRLEGVPAYVLKLAGVPTEENYETHVENIVAEYTAAQADSTNNDFTKVPKPIGSNQKVDISTIKPATKEELDSVYKEIK